MRRHAGPVQQWIDSIPLSTKSDVVIASECQEYIPDKPTEPKDIPFTKELKPPSMTVSAPNVPTSSAMSIPVLPSSLPHHRLARDASFQSDSSHCSSVESLLELRKADPTAILLDLGFGGCSASPQENGPLSRIPKRFLQPSSLKGIAIDDFVKHQQQTNESIDSVSLGYRGLTGSPYVAPSEIVQKIMERLREHDNHEADANSHNSCEQYSPQQQNGKLSVLSPHNRQFLEQPRSKSPDMRNKRMIIGQKSFAFGCDGNLIEIPSTNTSIDKIDEYNATLDSDKTTESNHSSSEESVTFEYSYFSKNDEKRPRLSKSLFDDIVEFPRSDELLKEDNQATSMNNLNVAQCGLKVNINQWEYNASDTIPEYENRKFLQYSHPNIRRASDGSCNTKSLEDKMFNEGRRFSDGAVYIAKSQRNEYALSQKRKSLRRQSRVCDTTAMQYFLGPIKPSLAPDAIFECNVDNEEQISHDVTDTSTNQLQNIPKSFQLTESKDDLELKTDAESHALKANYVSSSPKNEASIDQIEVLVSTEEDSVSSDHSCTEDNQVCCYKGKVCKSCKHSKNCSDCCCHNKKKYLKKMEKIMQENKKLEDMLARSRREMAEIRDMLSNVLSVRMEPGF